VFFFPFLPFPAFLFLLKRRDLPARDLGGSPFDPSSLSAYHFQSSEFAPYSLGTKL